MALSRIKKFTLCCILGVAFSQSWSQESCESLQRYFTTSSVILDRQTNEKVFALTQLVAADDLCAKNLVGRMYHEGIFFDPDRKRALTIFYDLANRRYPRAIFNYAFVLSQDPDTDMNLVVNLLLGIYSNYLLDKNNFQLAIKARDFARDLISEKKLDQIGREFEAAIAVVITRARDELIKSAQQTREREDFLATLLTIGLAANAVAKLSSAKIPAPLPSTAVAPPPFPNFFYLFGNGPTLYMLPIR
jgi:hypothetical protein